MGSGMELCAPEILVSEEKVGEILRHADRHLSGYFMYSVQRDPGQCEVRRPFKSLFLCRVYIVGVFFIVCFIL